MTYYYFLEKSGVCADGSQREYMASNNDELKVLKMADLQVEIHMKIY